MSSSMDVGSTAAAPNVAPHAFPSQPHPSTSASASSNVRAQASTDDSDALGFGLASFYPTSSGPSHAGASAINHDIFMDTSFTLPLHTEELGRLPFHHGFSAEQHALEQAYMQDLAQMQQQQQQPVSTLPQTRLEAQEPGYFLRMTDYSELLSALSVPVPPNLAGEAPASGSAPAAHAQMGVVGAGGHAIDMGMGMQMQMPDVAMMSTENLAFADNMMEMWSAAPTSLE